MTFTDKPIAWYLSITERSQAIRTVVYGLTAFIVIFAIDLLWQFGRLNWYWGQLASNLFEAAVLALIASHLSRLREERIIRRHRELGYLNHHVRNSLAVIEMAEYQVCDKTQRTTLVQRACRQICRTLEQLSAEENVSLDELVPGNTMQTIGSPRN